MCVSIGSEASQPDLAGEIVREEDVPGGQISVDKVLPCQVAHPCCYVFPESYERS